MFEDEQETRYSLLLLASQVYGADHHPMALCEAAEVFYEYLTEGLDEV